MNKQAQKSKDAVSKSAAHTLGAEDQKQQFTIEDNRGGMTQLSKLRSILQNTKNAFAGIRFGGAEPVQRIEVLQAVWNRESALAFVTANPPELGELPGDWIRRIREALNTTDYERGNALHKNKLSNAFSHYYRDNRFTQERTNQFLEEHPSEAGQTLEEYREAQNATLIEAGFLTPVCDDFVRNAFEGYHRNHHFTQENANTFIADHVPERGQVFNEYREAHEAALAETNYREDLDLNMLSDAYDNYWVVHPFDEAVATAFFNENLPPLDEPQTADQYVYAHYFDITEGWHASATLDEGGVIDLFTVRMNAFRQGQTESRNVLRGYSEAVNAVLWDHVVNGGFNNGGPKGIHAYTNGGLPQGITVHRTIGNTNGVHVIIWSNAQSRNVGRCKWSSMFPINYEAGMAAWHILHRQEPGTYQVGARPTIGIPAWVDIEMGTAGNTIFPIDPAIQSAAQVMAHAEDAVDWINVNGNRRYRYTVGENLRYVIDN